MTKAKKDKLKSDFTTGKGRRVRLHDILPAKTKAKCKTTIKPQTR